MKSTAEESDDASTLKVESFLRESGVMRRIQQQAFDCDIKRRANDHGFEVLKISHRHDPAVEMALYFGTGNQEQLRLRSKVARLLKNEIVRVLPSKVFSRYRRSIVRVACVPNWD